MRRRLLPLIAALCLAATACSSGGADPADPAAAQSIDGVEVEIRTEDPTPGRGGSGGTGSGGAGGTASASPGPGGAATASPQPVRTPTGTFGSATPEGTYRYAQTAEATYEGKPIPYAVSPEGTLSVFDPKPPTQRQIRRYSSKLTQDRVMYFFTDRVLLSELTVKTGRNSSPCVFEDPPTIMKLPMRAGERWTDASRCGDFTWKFDIHVEREAARTVGGEAVSGFRVRTIATITGNDVTERLDITADVSDGYRLILWSKTVGRGTRGGDEVSNTIEETLLSTEPI